MRKNELTNERTTDQPTDRNKDEKSRGNTEDLFFYPDLGDQSSKTGGRSYPDLKLQSWAVTPVLSTEKVLSRRRYVAQSVLYRFDVEQWGP